MTNYISRDAAIIEKEVDTKETELHYQGRCYCKIQQMVNCTNSINTDLVTKTFILPALKKTVQTLACWFNYFLSSGMSCWS